MHAHAHTIRLRPTPYYTHMHMHMRLQYGTPYYMHMHTCASNTISLTMAFPSLHPTTWKHNYMDLAHNTARLVCCEYNEGEYNTCDGAACTSSIELTCSCACGRMALHVQTTTLGNLQSHARCVSCTYTRGMFQYSIMHVPSIVSCMFQYIVTS